MAGAPDTHTPDGTVRPPPGRFAPGTTLAYALLWLVAVIQGWGPLLGDDPATRLHYPESGAERMTSRDLELAEAIEATPARERALLGAFYGTREETLRVAVDVQQQLLDAATEDGVEAPGVRARLAVLLLEAGEPEEAAALLREDPPLDVLLPLLEPEVDWPGPTPGRVSREALEGVGLIDWYLDTAVIRAGDPEAADAARSALRGRGRSWERRSLAVTGANLLLVACGSALLLTRLRGWRRVFAADGGGPVWSLADGVGVFVRGDFWNRMFFLGLAWLWSTPMGDDIAGSPVGMVLQGWATLLASLPLLWLVYRHLLAPEGRRARQLFGLDAPIGAVLRVALCAIAIDLLGTHALAWSAWGLGASSSWAEGFDEMLVWGSSTEAVLTAADYVLWAPALEELAFRGLLYYSLRHRLGPVPAAILTASFFAGLHFYSLPGFLMTSWSGLVWALAFERLHSLLPGALAHAVYNGLYVAWLVLLYR